MAKTYFIDSENVGDSWIELLELEEDETSTFLVFYTSKSPRVDYEHVIALMRINKKPTFIPCFEGNNGLDFQLVSYLGYLLHEETPDEMIIVSKDTGFDAAVKFWKERGQKVIRKNPDVLLKIVKKEETSNIEDAPVSSAEDDIPQAKKMKSVGEDQKELYTIINCVGKDSTVEIHNACIHFYGSKKGEDIYKELKKEKFAAPSVSWKVSTKNKRFSDLIFKYCNPSNVTVPKDFQSFLNTQILATDTQKTVKNKFLKKYPNAQSLNKILMPFYSSFIKIKK